MAANVSVVWKQISESASQGEIRGHRVVCDRPEAKGGGDQGPMGGELLLAGQAGCFMSNLLAAAKAREARLTEAVVKVTGTMGEAPPRYIAIDLVVSAKGVDRQLLEKLVTIAERGCLVANTLKEAVPLTVTIQ
ncbi:MAG: OsmC family protein [Desulfosarcinaceae bacterium]